MRGHVILTIVSLAALSSAALPAAVWADTLPIKGSYGNKDGCAYAKSGESTGSDNFFLLTSEAITTAASSGAETSIPGFGKFKVKDTPERDARNPATGATIKVAATKKLAFTPAKALKDALNK